MCSIACCEGHLAARGRCDGARFYVDKLVDYVEDVASMVASRRLREPRGGESLGSTMQDASPGTGTQTPADDVASGSGPPARSVTRLEQIAALLAGSAASIGVAVLVGYAAGLGWLARPIPWAPSMVPNTALALSLSGAALLLLLPRRAPRLRRRFGLGLAALVLCLAVLTLLEYASGYDLHIDALLRLRLAPEQPLRPFPQTALSLLFIALALFALERPKGRLVRPADLLGGAAGIVALVAIAGIAAGATVLITVAPGATPGTAPHTALALVLLAFAVLLSRPEAGVVSTVMGDEVGSVVGRRMLLLVGGIPEDREDNGCFHRLI